MFLMINFISLFVSCFCSRNAFLLLPYGT